MVEFLSMLQMGVNSNQADDDDIDVYGIIMTAYELWG